MTSQIQQVAGALRALSDEAGEPMRVLNQVASRARQLELKAGSLGEGASRLAGQISELRSGIREAIDSMIELRGSSNRFADFLAAGGAAAMGGAALQGAAISSSSTSTSSGGGTSPEGGRAEGGPDRLNPERSPEFEPLPREEGGSVQNDATDEFNTGNSRLVTPGGVAFYDPSDLEYRKAAGDVPKYPGEYVVDIHGSSSSVAIKDSYGRWHEQNASEFAETIKASGWSGQPVRLFSCDTGKDAVGFAQQLSNLLGVPVTAPTTPVWSSPSGRVTVSNGEWRTVGIWPNQRRAYLPKKPPDGSWRIFRPK